MTQPDLHPDADALNAFVERALPDAERARIVAHMADCGRCREIVYLAQAAAEPELPPAVATVNPERRQSWLSAAFMKWRVALIPAAALATVGAVVLWVQLQHVMKPMEMASSAPQSVQPAPQPASASPGNAARPAEQENSSLALTIAPPAMPKPAQTGPPSAHDAKKAAAPAMGMVQRHDLAAASSIGVTREEDHAARSIHLDADSAAQSAPPPEPISPSAVSTFTPPTAASLSQTLSTANAALDSSARRPATTTHNASSGVQPASPNMAAFHGALAPPAAGGPAQVAVQSQPNPDLATAPSNGFALMRLTRKAKLPSGLDSVSSAALLDRLVAVDSTGSVFLSKDAGQHWEAVKAQWNGKAVAVHSPPQVIHPVFSAATSEHTKSRRAPAEVPATGSPEEGTNPAPLPPPPAAANVSAATDAAPATSDVPASDKITAGARSKAPEMLFKLVTDRHEIWVSVDGNVWRPQ